MSQLNTVLSGTEAFGPLRQSVALVFPAANVSYINDVFISLQGAVPEFASPAPFGLRLYFCDRDITSAYIGELQDQLGTVTKAEDFKKQYLSAAEAQMRLHETLSRQFTVPLDRDRALLESVKNCASLAPFLSSLGELDFGWGGRLHPFNYLFTDVGVSPVSLNTLLRRSSAPPITDCDKPFMRISGGDTNGGQEKSVPNVRRYTEGFFRYLFEFVYDNPLDTPIHNLQQAVQPGQHLDIVITDIKNRASLLLARIEQCNEALGDAHLAEALRDTLNELQSRLKL